MCAIQIDVSLLTYLQQCVAVSVWH